MDTHGKQLAINVFLAALYAYAVWLSTTFLDDPWGVIIATGIPVLRLFVGIFLPLPMDDPVPGPD